MTLKRRINRLEHRQHKDWQTVDEIPTPELEAMVRKAYREGNFSSEEAELFSRLEAQGFEFDGPAT